MAHHSQKNECSPSPQRDSPTQASQLSNSSTSRRVSPVSTLGLVHCMQRLPISRIILCKRDVSHSDDILRQFMLVKNVSIVSDVVPDVNSTEQEIAERNKVKCLP